MIRLIIILCTALLLLTACGIKGGLQPKGKAEPQAPAGLVIKQQGNEILLNWRIPTSNQDDSDLTDLAGFRIDLYSYQPDQYCRECRDQETLTSISIKNPAPALVQGDSLFYRDSGLDYATGYRYRIYPFTTSGRTGPPAEAHLLILPAPAAPSKIRAEELDRGVRLFWSLPESIQEQGELLGVNIYSGETGVAFNPVPLNLEPLKGNNFDNFGLNNGTTYQFGLRTVIRIEQQLIESVLSEIISATPEAGL